MCLYLVKTSLPSLFKAYEFEINGSFPDLQFDLHCIISCKYKAVKHISLSHSSNMVNVKINRWGGILESTTKKCEIRTQL